MDSTYLIREIEITDNPEIKSVIQALFIELKLPLIGTAYADPELNDMFSAYAGPRAVYFVVADGKSVFGGGGIRQLTGAEATVCELQKLYFSPVIRGLGLGKKIIAACLDFAKSAGFESCYLESKSELHSALHLFKSHGFRPLDQPLGNTGHHACEIQMIKPL
jgi:putative acetyltransferase